MEVELLKGSEKKSFAEQLKCTISVLGGFLILKIGLGNLFKILLGGQSYEF